MSNADRIEELRIKYEENPRRYFAPLANEFRKAGDLVQAIAICREHLPKQPGHMSGFIVFGQTLFEASHLDEARSVFEQALALDPENLIALKHLGDIARTKGENSVARRWYERVLDADPRNDDIALQLASLTAPTPPLALPVVHDVAARSGAPLLEDAIGVFATFDPSSLLDLKEAVVIIEKPEEWEPLASASPRPIHHEPIDLDFPDDPEPVASDGTGDEFEEGLIAPEWPDTSALVARLVTPHRSATPVSTPATPDALAAFGREAHETLDERPSESAPADHLVDAFLPATETEAQNFADLVTDEYPVVRLATILSENAITSANVVEFATGNSTESVVAELHELPAENSLHWEETSTPPVHEASLHSEEASTPPVHEASLHWEETSTPPVHEASLHWEEASTPPVAKNFETEDFSEPVTAAELSHVAEPEATVAEALQPTVFAEESAPTVSAEEATPTVTAEESYAEISTELQSERLASDERFEQSGSFESAFETESHIDPAVHHASAVATNDTGAPAFVTETMAELLVSQGFVGRAIEIYEELVHRNADDHSLVSRLKELRTHEAAITADAISHAAPTPRYNTPIRATPQYATPQYSAPQFSTPQYSAPQHSTPQHSTPQYSAPQFSTPHFSTPQHSTPQFSTPLSATPLSATPVSTMATPSYPYATPGAARELTQTGRTARDRFADLARRRVPRRTPTHATAVADDPSDGLSSLFGTTQPASPDELAARALADAFGPVQDAGESLFDLSSTPTPSLPLRALTPRSVTPLHASAAMSAAENRAAQQPNPDYSFDRFFPDPAVATRAMPSGTIAPASDAESSPPANEDLAQFSAWLKGLNNT